MHRAFSAEFPNDNAELHLGTIWMNEEPCGMAEAHSPPEEERVEVPAPGPAIALLREAEPEEAETGPDEPIEIVDSIAIGVPDEVVPAPADRASVEAVAFLDRVSDEVAPVAAASEVVLSSRVAEEIGAALHIPMARVPAFEIELEVDLAGALDEVAALASETRDPYGAFLQTLSDVARASGASIESSAIDARLAGDPVAAAWRAILRGESEDFALCATTLDEWASTTLAALLDAPSKVAQLRRELRAHGVAAFGLVEAA